MRAIAPSGPAKQSSRASRRICTYNPRPMAFRIIHVVDTTTSEDSVEALAALLRSEAADASMASHEIAVLGHRSTGALLEAAGISGAGTGSRKIHWLRSLGWLDPVGWRALAKLVDPSRPMLLHAWGLPAALACAIGGSSAGRVVTLGEGPLTLPQTALDTIDRGSWRRGQRKGRGVQWTGFTREVVEALVEAGVPRQRVAHVPLGLEEKVGQPREIERKELREQLGLVPEDGPVFLLAGDARPQSRHDYGLWAAGIVQQLFPRVRVIVREDLRNRRDHGLERLFNSMGDPDLPVVAPAEISWQRLLGIADVLMVTADGPVPMGAAIAAMMAGVPVVGTPIATVREVLEDGHTGLIARSMKARALAARVEELLADGELRNRLIKAAREESRSRHGAADMVKCLRSLYAMGAVAAPAGV